MSRYCRPKRIGMYMNIPYKKRETANKFLKIFNIIEVPLSILLLIFLPNMLVVALLFIIISIRSFCLYARASAYFLIPHEYNWLNYHKHKSTLGSGHWYALGILSWAIAVVPCTFNNTADIISWRFIIFYVIYLFSVVASFLEMNAWRICFTDRVRRTPGCSPELANAVERNPEEIISKFHDDYFGNN